MADYEDYDWKYYRYTPSLVAAIIFIILFAITTFLHLYQLVRTRTWYFVPLVVGGFFQWIGYMGRAIGSTQSPDWTLGPYIIQTLLLLLAPALFAASIYMELSRIVLMVDGERYAMIKRKWLTKIFVAGDVLSFTVQGGGGGIMAAGSLKNMKLGEKIVIAGIFIQIVVFGLFGTVAFLFHRKINKTPTPEAASPGNSWRKHIFALYAASAFIMIRSIFRAIEYIQGNSGYLLRSEVFLYVFDAVLMLGVMVMFNIVHPSEVKAHIKGGKMSKGLKMYSMSDSRQSGSGSV